MAKRITPFVERNNAIAKLCILRILSKRSLQNKLKIICERNAKLSNGDLGDILKILVITPITFPNKEEIVNRTNKESICNGCCRKFDK